MGATDWLVCPKCKQTILDIMKKYYGKVDIKTFEALKNLEKWYITGEKIIKEDKKLIQDLEVKENLSILPERTHSLRFDEYSFIDDKGILHLEQSYECDFCGSQWKVNLKFKEGVNEIIKDK